MKLLENTRSLLRASESPARDSAAVDLDAVLLESARAMDQDALIQIFDRYATALYRYALRLCSDPLTADQAIGDVFAKLLEQLAAGLGPRSNLRAYLYQMTYHLVVDEMRYSKRRAPLEALEDIGYEDSAFSSIEDRIAFEKVMGAIRTTLTQDQQNVIVLRFLEGLSLNEVALITGKQVNHVKVLQSRAIQRLRKALQENEQRDDQLSIGANRLLFPTFDFAS